MCSCMYATHHCINILMHFITVRLTQNTQIPFWIVIDNSVFTDEANKNDSKFGVKVRVLCLQVMIMLVILGVRAKLAKWT